MNKIRMVENAAEIRRRFTETFTLSEAAFREARREWLATVEKDGALDFNKLHLWDKMPDYRALSFEQALELLRTMEGEVLVMSEPPEHSYCHGITMEGREYKGGVACVGAAALAERLEYEWYEGWRAAAAGSYLENALFPDDVYVFDGSMEHLLVFTHENDFWELEDEQPLLAAASRFCMMAGFPPPKDVTYEQIRTLLSASPDEGAVCELEMYYSGARDFRPFTVHWKKLPNGMRYWLNFAPDAHYDSLEALEDDGIFNGRSLSQIAAEEAVRFGIRSLNGRQYDA